MQQDLIVSFVTECGTGKDELISLNYVVSHLIKLSESLLAEVDHLIQGVGFIFLLHS